MSQNRQNERNFEAPLLLDYKRKFVLKRVLQTIFGGCVLKFDYKVPAYIYINQIILYIIPFIFCGIGILIVDLVPTFDRIFVSLIVALIFCIYQLSLKIILKVITYRQNRPFTTSTTTTTTRATTATTNKTFAKRSNLLAEEDVLDFDDDDDGGCVVKCCSSDKLKYLMPNLVNGNSNRSNTCLYVCLFLFKLLIDTIIAGYIIFCSVYFYSLSYLYNIYSLGGNIVIFILSWFTICNSLYALLIREPFEIAVYDTSNDFSLNLNYTTRAFYVCCFFIVETIYNFAPSNAIPIVAIFWLKIVFICLPILWSFGVLPSFSAFFSYLIEQAYIHLYGGTATATNIRLIIQILLAVVLSMVYFIPNDIAIVALLSIFGYLLSSIDILHVFKLIKKRFKLNKIQTVSSEDSDYVRILSVTSVKIDENKAKKPYSNLSIECIKEIIYNIIMPIATITCSMLIFNIFTSSSLSITSAFQVEISLLYTCMGLFVLLKICSDLQQVYIIFGLVRNPFYPKNCLNDNLDSKSHLTINHNRMFFRILKYTRIVILKFIAPLVMCAVVTIDCYINKIYNDTRYGYMRVLFVLRAYRWIWQSTYTCLFEMSFMSHILLFVILYNTTTDTSIQSSLIKNYLPACMAASFLYDRLKQFLNQLFTFLLITLTSWFLKSQRRKLAKKFLIINAILFIPYILPVLILASIFSAPLLPLFTFPIYLIGFPRPKRFWPDQLINKSSRSTTNQDSYFYAQLEPYLAKSLRECMLTGSIGSNIGADTYFLSRFQDRIIWIQVLESSNAYCIVNVKGLELQETSCHTREAQYIDESFELTFENPYGTNANNASKACCNLNPNRYDCIQPCDLLIFKAYSDAKNTLVGILDSNDSHKLICDLYLKVLHYFLVKYLLENNKIDNKQITLKSTVLKETKVTQFEKPENKSKVIEPIKATTTPVASLSTISKPPPNRLQPIQQQKTEHVSTLPDINSNKKPTRISQLDLPDWSDTDSILNDFIDDIDKTKKKSIKKIEKKKTSEELFEESKLDKSQSIASDDEFDSGLFDITTGNGYRSSNIEMKKVQKPTIKDNYELDQIPAFNANINNQVTETEPQFYGDSVFNIPLKWQNIMQNENTRNNNSKIDDISKNFRKTISSTDWLRALFEFNNEKNARSTNVNQWIDEYQSYFVSNHINFLIKCFNCLDLNTSGLSSLNTQSIYKLYKGELPWSMTNEKITKEAKDLHSVLIKAFCYTIKLVIDSITITPIETDDEIFDAIKTYENEWFIGNQNDPEYVLSIQKSKPYIFSLFDDSAKKTINSRTLTLQETKSPIARLNSEVIKSIWSSTNLELLYMTNDDDERYSIQAHQYILRNLTIQASNPPLGYPIYNSKPLYISTCF